MGLFDLKGKKNATKLLDLCDYIIECYEQQNSNPVPSCRKDVKNAISSLIKTSKRELAQWDTLNLTKDDWNRTAHALIAQTTFDLLASGRYHIFHGMLNPMNCSSNLMNVYKCCMDYAVQTGEITEETKNAQLDYLLKRICEIG